MVAIANRDIGVHAKPFVIAEMSGNHNGSISRAKEIINAASRAGAHAVKLQTATPDGLTLDVDSEDFVVSDPESPWHGKHLHALYQDAVTPWEWHEELFAYCHAKGLISFSSPFELAAVDFLEALNVPCYKIASFENTDLQLIRKVAATGKPMIISTGMASVAELDESVRAAREAGCEQLVLLKCTSTYPATPENSHLRTIPHLRELFRCEVGLSDHTMGIGTAVAAVALGATVIEKHFTLRRADGGVDSTFSMEPEEMALLVTETERAWQSLGSIRYGPSESEKKSVQFRRSLYIAQDLQPGDILTSENVRCVRPGHGLPPKFYETVIGMKVTASVSRGTPLSWAVLRQS